MSSNYAGFHHCGDKNTFGVCVNCAGFRIRLLRNKWDPLQLKQDIGHNGQVRCASVLSEIRKSAPVSKRDDLFTLTFVYAGSCILPKWNGTILIFQDLHLHLLGRIFFDFEVHNLDVHCKFKVGHLTKFRIHTWVRLLLAKQKRPSGKTQPAQ